MSVQLLKTALASLSFASLVSTQDHLPDRFKVQDTSKVSVVFLNEDKTLRCKMDFKFDETFSLRFAYLELDGLSSGNLRKCDEDDIAFIKMLNSGPIE